MKKWFDALLVCVLTAIMLCTGAMAETTEIVVEAVTPTAVPLQEQIDAIAQDYPAVNDIVQGKQLAGKWHPITVLYGTSIMEVEGLLPVWITLNADGTGVFEGGQEEKIDCIVKMERSDDNEFINVKLLNANTNEMIVLLFLDNDPVGTEYPTMLTFISEEMMVGYYNEADSILFVPADEPAPVTADGYAGAQEISRTWMLTEGMVNGRKILFDQLMTAFVRPGMLLETYVDEGAEMIRFNDKVFGMQGATEDGGVVFVEVTEGQEWLNFYAHEDGRCSIVYSGATYVLEKYEIDPLTEYTDEQTVKAVQEAMNAEGYECGTPDGIAGNKTAAAISGYQAANGLTETGTVTYELLQSLRGKGYDL